MEAQGFDPPPHRRAEEPGCHVLEWASSGAMALTGRRNGPPLWPDGPLVHRVREMAAAVAAHLPPEADREGLDPAPVLTGRAAERGLRRDGDRSAGGHARLLAAADGWLAVSLPRPSDAELLPAVLGHPLEGDPWASLAGAARDITAVELVERMRLVGLAAATLPGPSPITRPPFIARRLGERRPGGRRGPLVVDLTAMWAGPLCAHLLGRSGARVVKVEDPGRPDGARIGDRRLFDRLHRGHEAVALDLSSEGGRRGLRALLEAADIVVESSRPRALAQLGVDAEAHVGGGQGRTWVSITGYGRSGEGKNWVAFGDDAAVAGGVVAWEEGRPLFCADAVADPLTGLMAAVGALAAHASGGGVLLDVAMAATAAFALSGPTCPGEHRLIEDGGRWSVTHDGTRAAVAPPRTVRPVGSGPALGADTARVLAEFCAGAAV